MVSLTPNREQNSELIWMVFHKLGRTWVFFIVDLEY